MKFYYPEWDKVNKVITAVDGEPISAYNAQSVTPSLMYLRVNMGEYVRFIDHFGHKVGGDFLPAVHFSEGGFANIAMSGNKPKYVDIFFRESDTSTSSGACAKVFFDSLYKCEKCDNMLELIEDMEDKYFADKIFYEGIIKIVVKYLRDLVQYEYDNKQVPTCEQIIRTRLSDAKKVCDAKRARGIEEERKEIAKENIRANSLKASLNFLDSFNIYEQPQDERTMVCVNEEDADEYDI